MSAGLPFRSRLRLCLALVAFTAAPHAPALAQVPQPGQVLATVNGASITLDDFHPFYRMQLRDLEQQMYQLQRRALDELVTQRLLTLEANKLGLTIEQLVAERVDKYVTDPTEAAIDAYYEEHKANAPPVPVEELKRSIATHLRGEQQMNLLRAVIDKLKADYGAAINLEPPRYTVAAEGPSRGPDLAPVTILSYTEFECAPCAQAQKTVARLFEEFPTQLRQVYKAFPIDTSHTRAVPAAVAAACAHKQGRFWEYHDRLFSQQNRLGPDDLVGHAKELGLDFEAFRTCMNGTEAPELVAKDTQEGQTTGVTAVPTFFINGRPVLGTQPIDTFRQIIREEITRFAMPGAPPRGATPPPAPPKPPKGE
jgi:protein-disulfide isomerase